MNMTATWSYFRIGQTKTVNRTDKIRNKIIPEDIHTFTVTGRVGGERKRLRLSKRRDSNRLPRSSVRYKQGYDSEGYCEM